MFADNGMEKEAKQLFAHLELTTNKLIRLDILVVMLQGLGVNPIKDKLISEQFPLLGGTLLKFIDLVLELIELVGDRYFHLIEIFLQLSSIESVNK